MKHLSLSLLAFAVITSSVSAATESKEIDKVIPSPVNYTFDDTPIDRSNRERVTSYADVLDKVTPAVVSVYTSRTVTISNGRNRRSRPYLQVPPPAQSPNAAPDDLSSYQRTVPLGIGSGSIISADGYILTNHHVVTDDRGRVASGILVKLSDGRELEAKFIGSDESTDIALLKIDAKNLPTVKLADSDKLKVGDIVFAVGNPLDVGMTVTQGIVSATGRSPQDLLDGDAFGDFIQTDASINPGNSGGPLVDANGRLVGLNSAIYSTSARGGSIGIGFAIPSSVAKHVTDSLIKDGKVRRGFLGVNLQEIDHDLAQALGLSNTHGALINLVDPALPAGKAGIRRGDVVVRMNNREVDSPDKLRFLVSMVDPGQTVVLTVWHEGEQRDVKVRLADREQLYASDALAANVAPTAAQPQSSTASSHASLLAGITLEPVTPEVRKKLALPDEVKGLLVAVVTRNSPYADGFDMGTVLIDVNKHPVTSLEELRVSLKPGAVNVFYVYRENHYAYVTQVVPAN